MVDFDGGGETLVVCWFVFGATKDDIKVFWNSIA